MSSKTSEYFVTWNGETKSVDDWVKTATRYKKLLRRALSWLDVALIHLKDHPELLENVQDLKKEISKEVNDART